MDLQMTSDLLKIKSDAYASVVSPVSMATAS
jgi:hypothetical protein